MSFNFPLFDQGLGRAKKGVDWFREDYVLGTLGTETPVFTIASVAASQANTTVAAYAVLPCRIKIAKIAVFCSAIGTVAGTVSFNIVLGTGAYTQGNAPGNDNSSVPAISYNSQGQPTATNATGSTLAGGAGISSNVAVPGNSLFANDVVMNVVNFPNLTTGTGTGANYAQTLIPSSPDAVWPNSGVLTLRFTTPAATTISNFIVAMTTEPYPLQATYPSQADTQVGGAQSGIPVPGVDF